MIWNLLTKQFLSKSCVNDKNSSGLLIAIILIAFKVPQMVKNTTNAEKKVGNQRTKVKNSK